jgi:hypothetical protein
MFFTLFGGSHVLIFFVFSNYCEQIKQNVYQDCQTKSMYAVASPEKKVDKNITNGEKVFQHYIFLF